MALVAPALLAADFARLGEALEIIKAAGASVVHVDVMDGHFVPEITVGQPVIASLRKATDLVLDVHLLIERPERYVADFVAAGADQLAVHVESTTQLHKALDLIRRGGAKAGVALNPATPTESLTEVWGEVDFVNVLTADPGLGEERFVAGSAAKVRAVAQARQERRCGFALQVEGAIGPANLEELVGAGADILVMGFAIFNAEDPQAQLAALVRRAAGANLTLRV
jgi:ribulose-phosphate 3-epimerase